MKKKLLFLLFGMTLTQGYGQKVLWEKTIGGEHSEYLFDMVPTLDYGFILAGSSLSDKTGLKKQKGAGNLDYFLWKMDKYGEEEWQLSFGGEGQDILKSIYPTKDMGYILGGYSNSSKSLYKTDENKGKNDIWIVKINAKGGFEWERSYGGEGDDRLVKIQQLNDGGYLILASTNSSKSNDKNEEKYGGLDYWILKVDKKGTVEWEKSYGGIYNDEPKTVLTTETGYLIGGISNSPTSGSKQKENFGGYDQWILELDKKGNLIKEYVLGSENDDDINEIFYNQDENAYLITGSTFSEGGNGNLTVKAEKGSDFLIIKTDLNFVPTNQEVYDIKGSEIVTSSILNDKDELLLAGYKTDEKSGKKSYVAIQINKNLENIWEKELSTNGDDLLRKAVVTRDGSFVFAGNSTGKNAEYKRAKQGRDDYWVVKLGSKEKDEETEIKLEAFPNPTEGYTQIVINHQYSEGVVNVFDLNGRLLHTEPLKHDMVAVNLEGYAAGAYVINIKTDVFNGSVKVIKK